MEFTTNTALGGVKLYVFIKNLITKFSALPSYHSRLCYGNGRNTSNGSNSYFGAQINSSSANFIMELTFRWVNGYWHGNGWVGTARPGGYYDDFRIFDAITANASGGTYYTTNGVNMKNFNIGTGTGIGTQWDDKFYLYGMKKVSS